MDDLTPDIDALERIGNKSAFRKRRCTTENSTAVHHSFALVVTTIEFHSPVIGGLSRIPISAGTIAAQSMQAMLN
jgi:hypothetical protein